MAGGTYSKKGIYYSNILPQGHGKDIPWTEKGQKLVNKVRNAQDASPKAITDFQNYMVSIGFLHENDVDGKWGPQVDGVIRRWNQGPGQTSDALLHLMKDFNPFDRGE